MRCLTNARVLLCAATLLNTAGCSFTFIDGVPDNWREVRYFDCTSTPGLAVADGVIMLSNGVAGVSALTMGKDEYSRKNDGANRNVVAGVSLGLAAVSAASGIYGIIMSENCRHAKEELRERLMPNAEHEQHRLSPPGLSPPLTPPPPETPPPPPASPEAVPQPTLVPDQQFAPENAPPTAAPPAGSPGSAAPTPPPPANAPVPPGAVPPAPPKVPAPAQPAR
jgi:hypothetical protein